MKKPSFRSVLLGLVLVLFLMQAGTTRTVKADDIGNCGNIYVQYVPNCMFWGWYCWDEQRACVDCDGGTYCYPIN